MGTVPLEADARERVRQRLAGESLAGLYAVLDGAASDEVVEALYASPTAAFALVWPEDPPADLFAACPFLLDCASDPAMLDWLLARWGRSLGIFLRSDESLDALARRLRLLVEVEAPTGETWICRFYDPAVLPRLLEVFTPAQQAEFLEGIAEILVEDADAGCLRAYMLAPDGLLATTLQIDSVGATER